MSPLPDRPNSSAGGLPAGERQRRARKRRRSRERGELRADGGEGDDRGRACVRALRQATNLRGSGLRIHRQPVMARANEVVQLRMRQAEKLRRVTDRVAAQPRGAQQRIVVGHSKGRVIGAPRGSF